jgi:hypothetical protein
MSISSGVDPLAGEEVPCSTVIDLSFLLRLLTVSFSAEITEDTPSATSRADRPTVSATFKLLLIRKSLLHHYAKYHTFAPNNYYAIV